MNQGWLVESQRELELEAIDLGVQRYREWRDRGQLGQPELQLVGCGIKRVEEAIQSVKDKILSEEMRAGPGFLTWAPLVAYFPADMLAGAALMATMEALVKMRGELPTRQHVIMAIGGAVETMFHLLKAKEMDKDLYHILSKTIKHWDGRRARRFYRRVTGLNRAFSQDERAQIGGFLFAHVQTTGWFVVTKMGKKNTWKVSLDPEVSGELAKRHEQLELLSPMLFPLVIPPADWDDEGRGGGYIYHKHPLFKPVNPGDKPPRFKGARVVLLSINLIQQTQWAINRRVLEVQEALWSQGGGVAGMVKREPYDVEREIPRIEGENDDEIRKRKKQREALHRANAIEAGARLEQLWRLRAARRMVAFPAFYHSWQLDWRGRIYPRASVLSPQGSDLDRGLLTFARPVPQTEDGRRWLCIHLANCWANDRVDKAPYSSRCAWVRRHEDRIRAVAADPLANRWWTEAENPWQFLAACFEYVRSDGLTQLPVTIDGTCNGLQHYSAIGRDEIGGRAVNLVPGDKPEDIYQDVADVLKRRLAGRTSFTITRRIKDAEGKVTSIREEIGRPWLPEITRKVVKRGVMTYPYGLTPIGMRDQLIEDGWMKDAPDPFVSATILRDLLQESIGEVVVKATEIMGWIKRVAEAANERRIPLQWAVPTGLVITQDYVQPTARRINLPGLGKVQFECFTEEQRKLHRQKQLNGTCPNFIHSYDAAHLMLTVKAAHDAGVKDFWLVHDSYGTHAPLVPTLQRVALDQFVGMYENSDPLIEFKRRTEERLGIQLPDPPARGSLDLAAVRHSLYAFG